MTDEGRESRTRAGQIVPIDRPGRVVPHSGAGGSFTRFSTLLRAESMLAYAASDLEEAGAHELQEQAAELRRSVKLAKNIELEKIIPPDG